MDRFARNREDTLRLVRELTDRGVIIQIGHTVYDLRAPWSKLFLFLLAAFAEAEGGWTSLRTQEAMVRPSVRKKLKGRQLVISPKVAASSCQYTTGWSLVVSSDAESFRFLSSEMEPPDSNICSNLGAPSLTASNRIRGF
jgi:DNA invertase Pin-like site-specific DNA recombinase